METYIKDLKLSQGTKIFLTWYMKITKVSELEGLNYLTFANKCPKNCNALAMADELKDTCTRRKMKYMLMIFQCQNGCKMSLCVITYYTSHSYQYIPERKYWVSVIWEKAQ